MAWIGLVIEVDQPGSAKLFSDDALALPLYSGRRRLRRVPTPTQVALAREAALGEAGRTCSKVARAAKRIGKFAGALKFGNRTANRSKDLHATLYFQASKKMFGTHTRISIATDATRLGKKEMLHLACVTGEASKAFWLPCQVPWWISGNS